jgi:hypothetical protein
LRYNLLPGLRHITLRAMLPPEAETDVAPCHAEATDAGAR